MKAAASKAQQTLILGIVLAILALGVYWSYLLAPLLRDTTGLGQQVKSAREQLQQIEQFVSQEAQLRQQHAQLSGTVQTFRTSLPSEDDLPIVIERLSDLASQSGVKIQTIAPQRSFEGLEGSGGDSVPAQAATQDPSAQPAAPQDSPKLYKEIAIQIDALAGFHQIGMFLSHLEADPQPVQLKSLRIASNTKELRRHTIQIVLAAYFALEKPKPATPVPSTGT